MVHSRVPQEIIVERILLIRGQKVILDRDLAELYGVETKYLNRQVKRNIERFPKQFMFKLTKTEKEELVTNWHRFRLLKHASSLPHVFTEHGVAMLASVLNSKQAIRLSIHIIEIFIKLRNFIVGYKDLAHKLEQLERKIEKHDTEIHTIFEAIRQLMSPPVKPKRRIGFHSDQVI